MVVEREPEVTIDSIPWEMVPKNARRVIIGYLEDIPSDLTVENPDSTQREIIERLDTIIGSTPFKGLSNSTLAGICFEEAALQEDMGRTNIALHFNMIGESLRSIAKPRSKKD